MGCAQRTPLLRPVSIWSYLLHFGDGKMTVSISDKWPQKVYIPRMGRVNWAHVYGGSAAVTGAAPSLSPCLSDFVHSLSINIFHLILLALEKYFLFSR